MKKINRRLIRLFLLIAVIAAVIFTSTTETMAGRFLHRGIYQIQTGYQKLAATYNLPFATSTSQSDEYGQVQVTRTSVGQNGSVYAAGDLEYRSTGLEDFSYKKFDNQTVIIYDDSDLDENDQQYASQAAQSWNNYIDQHIWMSLSNAKKINPNATATVIVRSVDVINEKAVNDNSLVVGEARIDSYGPVYINILHDKQITGDRLQIFEHEMGHAMGLSHVDLENLNSTDIMSYGVNGRQISEQNVVDARLIYQGLTN